MRAHTHTYAVPAAAARHLLDAFRPHGGAVGARRRHRRQAEARMRRHVDDAHDRAELEALAHSLPQPALENGGFMFRKTGKCNYSFRKMQLFIPENARMYWERRCSFLR